MPIKTTLFTDVAKFDGTNNRTFYSHEYTQMAGRAGRRGIDTVGHVIHLNNLFKPIDMTEYKKMMSGKPQKLVSKFKISYHLVLNLLASEEGTSFVKNSMIQQDIDADLKEYEKLEAGLREQLEKHSLAHAVTPVISLERYNECLNEVDFLRNKKKKDMEKEILDLEETYPSIKSDLTMLKMYNVIDVDYRELLYQKTCSEQFLDREVQVVSDFLEKDGFIDVVTKKPTLKGTLASNIREVHGLVFGQFLQENALDKFSCNQLVAMFSCFTNVTVSEDLKTIKPPAMMKPIVDLFEYYQDFESTTQINTGENYTIHYDLMEYTARWCSAETAEECKIVLQTLEQDKTIFLGEFIKAILKINNIAVEMEKIAEFLGNMGLLEKLKEIPLKTLKFVATNQSLYI
jgi:superfamily II RNA helicase